MISKIDERTWKSEWLVFHDRGKIDGGVTNLYEVQSNNVMLGLVMWKAGWRRYTFRPAVYTEFDFSCLTTIAEFVKMVTDERKAHWGQQGRFADR